MTVVYVPVLIGLLLAVAIQHGWLWLGRRRDMLALWAMGSR